MLALYTIQLSRTTCGFSFSLSLSLSLIEELMLTPMASVKAYSFFNEKVAGLG